MNRRILCAAAAVCAGSATVWAWSAEGHRAAADIAELQLKKSNQYASVGALLGSLTLSDIATCPDEVREYEREHKAKGYEMSPACTKVFPVPPTGTSPWHYVDIPVTLSSPTDQDIDKAY